MYQWQFNSQAISLVAPLIIIAMVFSLVGPAPRKAFHRTALVVMIAAVLDISLAFVSLLQGMPQEEGLLFIAAGIFAATIATWLARGESGGEDGGGGGEDKDQPDWDGPQPDGLGFDWDDFDDHRSDWEEDHRGRPVGNRS